MDHSLILALTLFQAWVPNKQNSRIVFIIEVKRLAGIYFEIAYVNALYLAISRKFYLELIKD